MNPTISFSSVEKNLSTGSLWSLDTSELLAKWDTLSPWAQEAIRDLSLTAESHMNRMIHIAIDWDPEFLDNWKQLMIHSLQQQIQNLESLEKSTEINTIPLF